MMAVDVDLRRLLLAVALVVGLISHVGAVDAEAVQAEIDDCEEFADILSEAREVEGEGLFEAEGFQEGFRLGFEAGFSFRGCLEQVGEFRDQAENGVGDGQLGENGVGEEEPRWFHEYNLSDGTE